MPLPMSSDFRLYTQATVNRPNICSQVVLYQFIDCGASRGTLARHPLAYAITSSHCGYLRYASRVLLGPSIWACPLVVTRQLHAVSSWCYRYLIRGLNTCGKARLLSVHTTDPSSLVGEIQLGYRLEGSVVSLTGHSMPIAYHCERYI